MNRIRLSVCTCLSRSRLAIRRLSDFVVLVDCVSDLDVSIIGCCILRLLTFVSLFDLIWDDGDVSFEKWCVVKSALRFLVSTIPP